jgi:hypothetical protein
MYTKIPTATRTTKIKATAGNTKNKPIITKAKTGKIEPLPSDFPIIKRTKIKHTTKPTILKIPCY